MKVKSVVVLGALALSGATLAAAPAASPASGARAHRGATPRAWMSTALDPAQRAQTLVAQMTLDEKIAMVHGAGYPLPLNAAGFAGVVPANTRLGIPALYLADSPVGVGNGSTGVTQWADTVGPGLDLGHRAGLGVRQRLRRRAGRQGPQHRAHARRSTSCGCRSGAAPRRRSARTRT